MDGDLAAARRRMVERQLVRRGIRDQRVLEAMGRVPRHMFVPPAWRVHAYDDGALPISEGQTISQPYIVAAMTEALLPGPDERVLEVGTGSGYQTAVLAELAGEVHTIERYETLLEEASMMLEELGYGNIRFKVGDGTKGWPAAAPFDGVLVTAGAPEVPPDLFEQLSPDGGRLVIPIGDRTDQDLYRYQRIGDEVDREWITSCRFVPLVGESGWQD